MKTDFFKNYSKELQDLLRLDSKTIQKLEKVKNHLINVKRYKKKI